MPGAEWEFGPPANNEKVNNFIFSANLNYTLVEDDIAIFCK